MSSLVSVCIGNDPKLRPHMSAVLAVLEKLQDPKNVENFIQTERSKSSRSRKKSPVRHNASPLWPSPGASPPLANSRWIALSAESWWIVPLANSFWVTLSVHSQRITPSATSQRIAPSPKEILAYQKYQQYETNIIRYIVPSLVCYHQKNKNRREGCKIEYTRTQTHACTSSTTSNIVSKWNK